MLAICSLRIKNNRVFFGPGTCELLERIEQTSSIRKATADMNLSYTKALRMLRDMREELGFDVVYSEKGGHNHGQTVLTDKGKLVLAEYKKLDKEITGYAQKLFEEKFNFIMV